MQSSDTALTQRIDHPLPLASTCQGFTSSVCRNTKCSGVQERWQSGLQGRLPECDGDPALIQEVLPVYGMRVHIPGTARQHLWPNTWHA